MKLLWHSYLVLNLGTRVMKLCTETDLSGSKGELNSIPHQQGAQWRAMLKF
jgi:hypothetical protein